MRQVQPRILRLILNFILFQLGWWGTVLGIKYNHPYFGAGLIVAILIFHFCFISLQFRKELLLVFLATLIGICLDSLISALGYMQFTEHNSLTWLAPPYMWLMWTNFALLLNHSLSYLSGRYILVAVFGALGGPLSYHGGAQLEVLLFPEPEWQSLLAIGVEWLIAAPLLFWLKSKLLK